MIPAPGATILVGVAPPHQKDGMQRRIRFSVLGPLDLRNTNGDVVRTVLAQPRRTAILAYLAAARPAGLHRRDALIATFWPESTERAARDLLNTNLSRLRTALGGDVIVVRGTGEVGLDDSLLWCDAREIQEALAARRLERVMELYRGDLLDGFHIDDAPAFDQWLSAERHRLRELVAGAALDLAEQQRAAGDLTAARQSIVHGAALAGGNEGTVRRAIQLLDAIGDRAGALQLFGDFATKLRDEYDAEPAPETRAIAERVRTRGDSHVAPSAVAIATEQRDAGEPSATVARRRGARVLLANRAVRIAALAVLLLGAATAAVWLRGSGSAAPPPTPVEQVAVFPFEVNAPDAEYLREGMIDLLTAKLDGADALRGVDPRAVLHRLRPEDSSGLELPRATAVARDLDARYFVLGSAFRVGHRLRLHASLYDRDRADAPAGTATADGDPADVFGLVDQLARSLLADRFDEPSHRLSRVGAATTRSVEALKAYLEGERLYRKEDFAGASEAFLNATRIDPSFALAHYRVSTAAAWLRSDSVSRAEADRAVALSATVPENEAMLMRAWRAYVYGEGDRAEAIYRTLVTERPTDTEAWYRLAEVLFHYGPTYGHALTEAGDAFERLFQFEPDNLAAVVHLARVAAFQHDGARLDTLRRRARELGAPESEQLELSELSASLTGDRRLESTVRRALSLKEEHLAEWIARAAIAFAEDPDAARRLGLARQAAGSSPQAVLTRILLAHAELAQGRWAAASAELDLLSTVAPALARELHIVLATLPFMTLHPGTLRALLAVTPDGVPLSPGYAAPGQLSLQPPWTGRYARGLLHAALGERGPALAIATELEQPPAAGLRTRDDTLLLALRQQLARGLRVRVLERSGNTAAALRTLGPPRLPSLRVLPGIMQHPTAAERFLRARLLHELGRDDEALRWLSSIPDPSGYDAVYLAPSHLLQGTILEQRGDTTAAARHYERVAQLYAGADDALQPMRRAALDALGRLRHR